VITVVILSSGVGLRTVIGPERDACIRAEEYLRSLYVRGATATLTVKGPAAARKRACAYLIGVAKELEHSVPGLPRGQQALGKEAVPPCSLRRRVDYRPSECGP
jgi:hypothetical protein